MLDLPPNCPPLSALWTPPKPVSTFALREQLAGYITSRVSRSHAAMVVSARLGTIIPPAAVDKDSATVLVEEEHARLSAAQDWFVDDRMTARALSAARTLPDWPVNARDAPSTQGFMVFASPIGVYHSVEDMPVPIVACSWGRSPSCEPASGGAWITFYSAPRKSARAEAMKRLGASTQEVHRILGRTNTTLMWDNESLLVWGAQTHEFSPGRLVREASATLSSESTWPWVKTVLATWHLIEQDTIGTVSETPVSKQIRRKAERRNLAVAPIRVVSIHRKRYASGPARNAWSVSVRFEVAEHWRLQPYGPGRSLRQKTLIEKHWRGPLDGPVRSRPAVRVVEEPPR